MPFWGPQVADKLVNGRRCLFATIYCSVSRPWDQSVVVWIGLAGADGRAYGVVWRGCTAVGLTIDVGG